MPLLGKRPFGVDHPVLHLGGGLRLGDLLRNGKARILALPRTASADTSIFIERLLSAAVAGRNGLENRQHAVKRLGCNQFPPQLGPVTELMWVPGMVLPHWRSARRCRGDPRTVVVVLLAANDQRRASQSRARSAGAVSSSSQAAAAPASASTGTALHELLGHVRGVARPKVP
jgi:hypothetical protein